MMDLLDVNCPVNEVSGERFHSAARPELPRLPSEPQAGSGQKGRK
jgi:hypothetical protein